MPHDPDDLVDVKQIMGEISLLALILLLIFILLFVVIIVVVYYYLDLPNYFDEIEHEVIDSTGDDILDSVPTQIKLEEMKYVHKIELKKTRKRAPYELNVWNVLNDCPSYIQSDNFDQSIIEFCRLAFNTHINEIVIYLYNLESEEIDRILEALSDFDSDTLRIYAPSSLPQLNPSALLYFNLRFRIFWTNASNCLPAQDVIATQATDSIDDVLSKNPIKLEEKKNVHKIELKKMTKRAPYELNICNVNDCPSYIQSDNIDQSIIEFCRLAFNTHINEISVYLYNLESEEIYRIFEVLSHFDSDSLRIYGPSPLSQSNLSILLSFTQKFRKFWTNVSTCPSATEDVMQIEHEVIDPTRDNLKEVHLEGKKLVYQIDIKMVDLIRYELNIWDVDNSDNGSMPDAPSSARFDNFDEMMQEFGQLSLNTVVNRIEIHLIGMSNEQIDRIFEALADFEADTLSIYGLCSPHIDVFSLLSFTRKFRKVWTNASTPLSARDVYILRKIILECECKLEDISVGVARDVAESLMKELFGATVDESYVDSPKIFTRIYRTTNESVEAHLDDSLSSTPVVQHFQKDIHTAISIWSFDLKECNEGEVIDPISDNLNEHKLEEKNDSKEQVENTVDSIPTQLNNKVEENKKFYRIELKVTEEARFELITMDTYKDNPSSTQYDNFDEVMQEFCRLSLNAQRIMIENVDFMSSEQIDRLFDALSDFDADELEVWRDIWSSYILPLNLSVFLSLTQKFRKVWTNFTTSLSANEVYILHTTILEGGCKLQDVFIRVDNKMTKSLPKELFGVTIEDDDDANTRIYRATDESIELYLYDSELHHFQGDIHTTVGKYSFSLKKCNIDEKTKEKYQKIKFNHSFKSCHNNLDIDSSF